MIYLFRIISDENPDFLRDLVAEGSDTFLELHQVLQKDLGYDPTLLASFFLTTQEWEKKQEITLIDMMQDPGEPALTMDQVTLGEQIEEEDQRMIYLFDFLSNLAFYFELIETADQTSPRETPFIGHSKGEPPQQLALDLLMNDLPDEDDPYASEDEDTLPLEDIDPDLLDDGMPEDY
jgi:hypothetical protein